MTTTVEIDLSIKDLAEKIQRTPRQINNWKAAAERRLKRKLGHPDPCDRRVLVFTPDECREILKSGMNLENGNEQPQTQAAPNFNVNATQAEASIFGGMDAIVTAGDNNALAIGQALGQRWNQILWTSALQSMQEGMLAMQASFEEMHQSVSITVNQPQLIGANPQTPRLEGE
jgi:hypothetical protein